MLDWYNYSWNDVVRELQSDANIGLSKEKIELSRKNYGENSTLNLEIKSVSFLFIKQIINIYALIGLGICILLFVNKNIFSATILSGILLFSVVLHTLKDYNNDKNLKELEKIIPKEARVKREGRVQKINCEELVVGDIVYLEEGDIVPADLRLIQSRGLRIKESALTGDNSIVEKYSTKIEDKEISLSERKNMAFKSSFVINGTAIAIVTAIGENSEIGKITKGLMKGKHERNLLERNISNIINTLTIVFFVASFFLLLYNYLNKNYIEDISSLIAMIYLVIVPVQIIIVIGIISLILNKKMEAQGVYFKGLSALQRLSNTNITFVDKVGTLTEDKMYVSKIYTNGKVFEKYHEDSEEDSDNIYRILNIGILCNDAKMDFDEEGLKGELTEISLVKYGFKKSIDKVKLDKEQERILHIPYDRDKRIKTTLNKIEDKYRANVKGSVDKLIERCTHMMKNGIEMEITSDDIYEIRNADLNMSKESLYVQGVAYRNFNYEPSVNENIESNLVFVGLIGFDNPIKEEGKEHLDYCRRLAIKPVLITEDNKITAKAFGGKIGLLKKNDIVFSGVELDHMEEKEFEKYAERVGIYSKISSKNKWQVSSVFKNLGYNLTVTGNKFTDSPSFRIAHVGVATGKRCTEITKKLGDIYIENNDFINLLSLIEESRKLMKTLKDTLRFLLTVALGEFIAIVLPTALGYKEIMNPGKLISINFVTVILSALYIYSQCKNASISNYDRERLDRTVLKSLTGGMVKFGVITGVMTTIALYFGNKNNPLLNSPNTFIILNTSPILFSHYFLQMKKCLKNRLSISILILNIIIGVLLFRVNFNKEIIFTMFNDLKNIKIIASVFIIQVIMIFFMKKADNN